jgi:hypothetical protein
MNVSSIPVDHKDVSGKVRRLMCDRVGSGMNMRGGFMSVGEVQCSAAFGQDCGQGCRSGKTWEMCSGEESCRSEELRTLSGSRALSHQQRPRNNPADSFDRGACTMRILLRATDRQRWVSLTKTLAKAHQISTGRFECSPPTDSRSQDKAQPDQSSGTWRRLNNPPAGPKYLKGRF